MTNQQKCEFKKKVINQLKARAVDEEIKNHLRDCADCCETEKILNFMQIGIASELAAAKLPTAGFVWWKAQILNKRQAAARAAQPLFIARICALIVAFIVCFWLLWTLPSLNRAAGQLAAAMEQILPYLIGGFCAFSLISLSAIILMRRIFVNP